MEINDRKQRMNFIKERMLGMGTPDFDYLISLMMMAYGISKRDARDEVRAVAKLEGLC